MPGVVAPPDIEVGVLARLHAQFDARATVDWSAKKPWPCLRAFRVGGTADSILRVDSALMQLETIGAPDDVTSTTRKALRDLLADAMADLVGSLPGVTFTGGVFTSRPQVVTGLQWAPDDTTHQQRYLTRLTVAAHAV